MRKSADTVPCLGLDPNLFPERFSAMNDFSFLKIYFSPLLALAL